MISMLRLESMRLKKKSWKVQQQRHEELTDYEKLNGIELGKQCLEIQYDSTR